MPGSRKCLASVSGKNGPDFSDWVESIFLSTGAASPGAVFLKKCSVECQNHLWCMTYKAHFTTVLQLLGARPEILSTSRDFEHEDKFKNLSLSCLYGGVAWKGESG